MNEKRPIDHIRESGGRIEIGTPDDPSDITAMLSIDDVLYAIKKNGIYAVKLADAIDPERTNPNIPPIQQRILAYGSESSLVGQTLLTAKQLFNEQVLPDWFDCKNAIVRSLEALKDLAAMHELVDAFKKAQDDEVSAFSTRPQTQGALALPSIGDVEMRCKTFFQKADHVSRSLLSIIKLFYKKKQGIGGIDELARFAIVSYGKEDPFTKYLDNVAPTLKYIRLTRNCLEHPNPPAKQAIIHDFTLLADGNIAPPNIEIISRPDTYPPADVSVTMEQLSEALPQIFEGMLACLCSKHMQSIGGLDMHIIELAPEQRGHDRKHVRFSYGVKIGDEIAPLG